MFKNTRPSKIRTSGRREWTHRYGYYEYDYQDQFQFPRTSRCQNFTSPRFEGRPQYQYRDTYFSSYGSGRPPAENRVRQQPAAYKNQTDRTTHRQPDYHKGRRPKQANKKIGKSKWHFLIFESKILITAKLWIWSNTNIIRFYSNLNENYIDFCLF